MFLVRQVSPFLLVLTCYYILNPGETGLTIRKLPASSSRLLFRPFYPIQNPSSFIPDSRLDTLSISHRPRVPTPETFRGIITRPNCPIRL